MDDIIYAFPTTGKTYFQKKLNEGLPPSDCRCVDLDIRGPKPGSPKQRSLLGSLAAVWVGEGRIVLTHSGSINEDCLPLNTRICYVIPADDVTAEEWVARSALRGDSQEWRNAFQKNFYNWRNDWIHRYRLSKKRFKHVRLIKCAAQQHLSDIIGIGGPGGA